MKYGKNAYVIAQDVEIQYMSVCVGVKTLETIWVA
jgi:hypothetical protein